jgi:hypothetical protein
VKGTGAVSRRYGTRFARWIGVPARREKTLPSLQAYLIVKPDQVWARGYERDAAGGWPERKYEAESETIMIRDVLLTLREVYAL